MKAKWKQKQNEQNKKLKNKMKITKQIASKLKKRNHMSVLGHRRHVQLNKTNAKRF